MENIKERGKQGAPKGIDNGVAKFREQEQLDRIIELRLLGKNITEIAKIMKTTRQTIGKFLSGKTYQNQNIEKLIEIKNAVLKELIDNKIKQLVNQGKLYRQIQVQVNRSPSYISSLFQIKSPLIIVKRS